MVGLVGEDRFGRMLVKNLRENRVNVKYVLETNANTGAAFITIDKKGANSIVVVPGANNKFNENLLKKAFKIISPNDIVITQLEIPTLVVYRIIKETKKRGALMIFNPSPIKNIKKEILKFVDIMVVNEIGASTLSGIRRFKINEMALRLVSLGAKKVIITLGKHGALLCDSGKNIKLFPTLKVKTVDTTAAGNAFLGALAASLLKNKSIDEDIKIANIAGALSTTKYGAQPSLPTDDEIEKYHFL